MGRVGRGLKVEPPAARAHSTRQFLQFFNKSNTFLGIFRPNNYFKAISHQLKAFKISLNIPVLNKINEVQVL